MIQRLAIIPARGGSKRIPQKNIRDFLGRPIISYSIEAAIQSGLFSEVIVSTDSREIADIAIKYGASVPFLRSTENATDLATTSDVLLEVINSYKQNLGQVFAESCCIYPTAPFITSRILTESYSKFKTKDYYSLFSITAFSFPIQRAFRLQEDRIQMLNSEYSNTRSQDLEVFYQDAGQFYWFKINEFLSRKKLLSENSTYYVLNEIECQDIDNETDWRLAELKYQLLKSNV
jgi:N-acylneuraminate cytidylyltransferase